MEKYNFIRQYTFSGLLDGSFKMLKYTWRNTLILGVSCLLPVALLSIVASNLLFKGITKFLVELADWDYQMLIREFLPSLRLLLLIALFSALLTLVVRSGVALTAYRAANGEAAGLRALVLWIIKEKLLKLVLQSLLITALIIGVSALAIGVFVLLTMVAVATDSAWLIVLVLVLFYIAYICLLVWISVSLTFTVEALLFEDCGVAESLSRSFSLVRRNWWRVLGITMLINIILSFAVSTLTGPLTFGVMAPFYNTILENLVNNSFYQPDYFQTIFEIYEKAALPLAVSAFIQQLLSHFILPVFMCLFYLDLRCRKEPPAQQPVTAGPGAVPPGWDQPADQAEEVVPEPPEEGGQADE